MLRCFEVREQKFYDVDTGEEETLVDGPPMAANQVPASKKWNGRVVLATGTSSGGVFAHAKVLGLLEAP
jgi:hypothetical protein